MEKSDLFDNYPSPFFVIEPIYNENGSMVNFRYKFVNESFARFLGKSKDELLGHDFVSVFGNNYEIDWMNFFNNVIKTKGFVAETRFTSVISRTVVIESFYINPGLCASFIKDYYSSSNGDSIDGNRSNIDVLFKAYHDYMTNFYNETYLKENRGLIEKVRNVGLVFLDINNLRKTNNEKGHRAGDQLILDFSKEIRNNFKGHDYFRLGGDEFLVITMGLGEKDFVNQCENVKKRFKEMDIATLGYKFYETIENLSLAVLEVSDLMKKEKMLRKNNDKK